MTMLPLGWIETTIGEVCEIVSGSTPKTTVPEYWNGSIPWVTPDDLSRHREKQISAGARFITDAGYQSCSTRMVPTGAVLFTSRAPIGYVAIATQPVCTNQGFKNFIPRSGISSDYLYWYLRGATPAIREMGSGTTFAEISGKVARTIRLLIPPLAEQHRIVDVIEEQFSRLDAGVASLRRAQRNLGRLRAAILAAAVAGRLVEREGEWASVRLGDLGRWSSGKSIPKSARLEGPIPVFGANGLVGATTEPLFSKPVLLLGRVGANVATGQVHKTPGPAWVTDNALVLQPSDEGHIDFLALCLRTADYRSIVAGSGQPLLIQSRVKALLTGIPAVDEQRRIVAEVERQFSILDAMQATVTAALARAERLRQSILREAFAGRLVPQDPDDEPASALLTRIATERTTA